jgi:hypothetical protein
MDKVASVRTRLPHEFMAFLLAVGGVVVVVLITVSGS